MKKIFTLLFGMAIVTGAFAQHGGNRNGGNQSSPQGNSQYQGRGNNGNSAYNNSNSGYGSQSGNYNSDNGKSYGRAQGGYGRRDDGYRRNGRDRDYSYNQRDRDRYGRNRFADNNYRRERERRGHRSFWHW